MKKADKLMVESEIVSSAPGSGGLESLVPVEML